MFRHRFCIISCPIPLLLGAASLYALNTANLRALETILCVLSMIGGEERRCLAMATKPNKNLNSSRFDRGGAYGRLQDTLSSRVHATPIELVRESTSCIYKVKAPLTLFVILGRPCQCADIATGTRGASPFNIGYCV